MFIPLLLAAVLSPALSVEPVHFGNEIPASIVRAGNPAQLSTFDPVLVSASDDAYLIAWTDYRTEYPAHSGSNRYVLGSAMRISTKGELRDPVSIDGIATDLASRIPLGSGVAEGVWWNGTSYVAWMRDTQYRLLRIGSDGKVATPAPVAGKPRSVHH